MAGFIEKPTILCHCEERSDVAILKFEVWHPVAKHGSTKQEEIPITKNRRFAASFRFLALYLWFCFVPLNHISLRDGKSFRQRLPRRAQKLRPPRNDKFGGFCGETKQFPERNDRKRNNFRNETFESRCGAMPHRCFLGSAVSRGRRLAFPVRSIFHTIEKSRYSASGGSGLSGQSEK